jgi:TetR/AcrR family transcriptional regulator, cholesterol catabolism regulator
VVTATTVRFSLADAFTPTVLDRDGPATVILDVVIDLLEAEGYEGVQLREVARRCHTSLSTIYKYFPSRPVLLLNAVERWMATRVYANLPAVVPGESLETTLNRFFGRIFSPWRARPSMYGVFIRARTGPEGERLQVQGEAATAFFFDALLATVKPEDLGFVMDALVILNYVVIGLFARAVTGEIGIEETTMQLERTVHHLVAGRDSLGQAAVGDEISER